ncbi:MAG: L,D-transpeptidase family protein [candidate division WOR-3 bacterium]
MRETIPVILILLACGTNQGKTREPSLPTGAISTAWSEAEKSYPEIMRQAMRGDSQLLHLYEKRAWKPLLFSSPYLNDNGHLVLTILENRIFDGMPSDPRVDSALIAIRKADSMRLATARLTDQRDMIPLYRACLQELATAEVILVKAWRDWAREMGGDTNAIRRLFDDPLAASTSLEPPLGEYRTLRATLSAYSRLPDWKPLSFSLEKGKKILPGDTGSRVSEIQERLKAEGFYSGPITGVYDSATVEAVKTFQKWHYLDEDGVVGWGTVRAMNVPRKELMARLSDALTYWRTTPLAGAVARGGWVFRINIPEFILYVYRNGNLIQKNKVAVGAADRDTNFTPTMMDTIEFIVINPKWNVPDRIFEEEILEEIYDSGDAFQYIEKKKLNVVSKKGKMWLVRDPGEGNALGRVKFLFPNRYNIYLHDTPIKSTFALKTRTVSHGCIRLDGAIQLAIDVLTENEGWTEKGFYEALDTTEKENGKTVYKETWVPLRHKIPIFIEYVLAMAEPGAERATFLQDIYGKTRKRAR